MQLIFFLIVIGLLYWIITSIYSIIVSVGLWCSAFTLVYSFGIVKLVRTIFKRRQEVIDKKRSIEAENEDYQNYLAQKRRIENAIKNLMLKYNNEEIVRNIIQQKYWQGQTAEQLLDSIGAPEDVDPEVIKDKRREIWKYNRQGKGRYGFRVILEDGIVIGWRGSRTSDYD